MQATSGTGSVGTLTNHATQFLTNNTERMRIATDGKVGIGETTPLAHVHIKTGDTGLGSLNTGADELFLESATGANCGMTIASGNGTAGYVVFADQDSNFRGVVSYDHAGPYMRFFVEGSEKLRLQNDGYLGVGTSSPRTNTYEVSIRQ